MNLRSLQYFVKLADLRHFSKAADACFVSQPTLSTQVRKLEEELGVQLVERTPRQVMLTPIGQDIADRARLVLSDINQIRAVARRSGNPAEGSFRLGLFPTLAPYLLPHIVPAVRDSWPQLRLQLIEEKTEDIIRLLNQGELDAALLALPVQDDNLEIEVLFEEPFVLAIPEHHALSDRDDIQLEDLSGSELLLLEEGHCLREHALEVCALAGAHERVDFHATSMETLRQMVAAGVGITLMPLLSVKPPIARTANMILKPFSDPVPSRTIAMVWRGSSALASFVKEMAACINTLPSGLLDPESKGS